MSRSKQRPQLPKKARRSPSVDQSSALFSRALAAHNAGRLEQATDLYRSVIAEDPRHAAALNNLSVALRAQGRLNEALESANCALAIHYDYADAWYNRAVALQDLEQLEQAIASYNKSLDLKPDTAQAYNNRGVALRVLKRLDEAFASLDRAVTLKPDYADAWYNRGLVLHDQQRYVEAVASYQRFLEFLPDHAPANNSLAVALQMLHRLDEALAACDRALELAPDFAGAHFNRANVLFIQKRWAEAVASYERACLLTPSMPYALSTALMARMHMCVWDDFDRRVQEIVARVEDEDISELPFPLLAASVSPGFLQRSIAAHAKNHYVERPILPRCPLDPSPRKIRLGYLSADFHAHPVGRLIADVIERHDRSRFEVIGFSSGRPQNNDAVRRRLVSAFDRFVQVFGMRAEDIARCIDELRVDIVIDLGGHTENDLLSVLACRPAPVQMHFLGFAGTLGLPSVDYLVADSVVIPEEQRPFYSEKIIYLPDSYMPGDSSQAIADRPLTRGECGLPDKGFVFCCFNASFKITPALFDVWMRLLIRVDGSVLWLSATNDLAMENLRKEAIARGVAAERIVFAERLDNFEEHLARHRLADLFLDTFNYNAHATANYALWAGLPVLTCPGETYASRVAASLLHAMGLSELIAGSPGEYEDLAFALATQPEKLLAVRQRLLAQRTTSALFDSERFVRHLEDAYAQVWGRCQAGLAPDDIHVAVSAGGNGSVRLQESVPPCEIFDRAMAAHQAGNLSEAERLYRAVLAVENGNPPALSNLASILKEFNRLPEALVCAERAIAAAPSFPDAWYNRGLILDAMHRKEEALASYDRAVALNPEFALAWFNRGLILCQLKRQEEALPCFERVMELDPTHGLACNCKVGALCNLKRWEEALAASDQALAISPADADAHYFRGAIMHGLRRWAEAAASFERAVALKPGRHLAGALALHCRMLDCNWIDYQRRVQELLRQTAAAEVFSSPFMLLAMTSSPEILQRCTQAFVEDQGAYALSFRLPPRPVGQPRKKIRLGYFSGDFYQSPGRSSVGRPHRAA